MSSMSIAADWSVEIAGKNLAANLPEEDAILRHNDRFALLGTPNPDFVNDPENRQEAIFTAMSRWIDLQNYMLENHCVAFAGVTGIGHRRVAASEQAPWALKKALHDARKSLDLGLKRATHVDVNRLSASEAVERTNAMARLSSTQSFLKQRKKVW